MSMRVNIGPLAVQLRNGLVSLAMLLLAACASAAEAEAPDPPSYVTEARVPWADLPQYQRNVFADGRVSFEEYEQAASDTVSCIRAAGVSTDDPVLERNRTYSIIVEVSEGRPSSEVQGIVSGCMSQYFSVVQMGWADEIHDPVQAGEFDRILVACLRDEGIETDPDNLLPILEAHPEMFNQCSLEAIDATREP